MGEVIHVILLGIFRMFPILLIIVLSLVVILLVLAYWEHLQATGKVAIRRGKEYCKNSSVINKIQSEVKDFTAEVGAELRPQVQQQGSAKVVGSNYTDPRYPKNMRKTILALGGIAAVIILAIIVVSHTLEQKNSISRAEALQTVGAVSNVFPLEPFIVNIKDGQEQYYLKVQVELEMVNPAIKGEIEGSLAPIRDSILKLLSKKTLSDIEDNMGKNTLKEEIMTAIDNHITPGKIGKIYFTDFKIQ